MTEQQKYAVRVTLIALKKEGATEFHHGDCVGCDETAHYIAMEIGYTIIIHPPQDTKHRAHCVGAKAVLQPKGFLYRNKDIVYASDILIATPETTQEQLRSGTWATIRYAKAANRQVIVIPATAEKHEI